jgi:hypothetical protein
LFSMRVLSSFSSCGLQCLPRVIFLCLFFLSRQVFCCAWFGGVYCGFSFLSCRLQRTLAAGGRVW